MKKYMETWKLEVINKNNETKFRGKRNLVFDITSWGGLNSKMAYAS